MGLPPFSRPVDCQEYITTASLCQVCLRYLRRRRTDTAGADLVLGTRIPTVSQPYCSPDADTVHTKNRLRQIGPRAPWFYRGSTGAQPRVSHRYATLGTISPNGPL